MTSRWYPGSTKKSPGDTQNLPRASQGPRRCQSRAEAMVLDTFRPPCGSLWAVLGQRWDACVCARTLRGPPGRRSKEKPKTERVYGSPSRRPKCDPSGNCHIQTASQEEAPEHRLSPVWLPFGSVLPPMEPPRCPQRTTRDVRGQQKGVPKRRQILGTLGEGPCRLGRDQFSPVLRAWHPLYV